MWRCGGCWTEQVRRQRLMFVDGFKNGGHRPLFRTTRDSISPPSHRPSLGPKGGNHMLIASSEAFIFHSAPACVNSTSEPYSPPLPPSPTITTASVPRGLTQSRAPITPPPRPTAVGARDLRRCWVGKRFSGQTHWRAELAFSHSQPDIKKRHGD